ncbi:hypothetical protein QFZ58_006273 [Streptomyces sp. B1I3]|nr:hypothetical protein [Streptomyces sp. B1I3]
MIKAGDTPERVAPARASALRAARGWLTRRGADGEFRPTRYAG